MQHAKKDKNGIVSVLKPFLEPFFEPVGKQHGIDALNTKSLKSLNPQPPSRKP